MDRVRTEVAVIGAGITGLAAAWALMRRDRDVVLLERSPVGHDRGGSHGSCRIFRLGYDDPEYVSLARRARPLWALLESAYGEPLLKPTPQLTFGPQMDQVRMAMEQAGAACSMLPADRAAAQFPGLRAEGDVLLEPESAVIAAERSLSVLARLCGPALRDEKVTALADHGDRVTVSTERSEFEARCAVVCAGPWTPGLLATAGIVMPGSATLEQVAYLAPAQGVVAPGQMPIFVHYGGEFAYGLPVPGSSLYKIGLHHGGPPAEADRQDHREDTDLSGRIAAASRQFLPGFEAHPVRVERCVYDNSPDEDFIVDRVGNVVIGSGTSGHGFKFGPLLGEWLADLAAPEGAPVRGSAPSRDRPPARFSLRRF